MKKYCIKVDDSNRASLFDYIKSVSTDEGLDYIVSIFDVYGYVLSDDGGDGSYIKWATTYEGIMDVKKHYDEVESLSKFFEIVGYKNK